MSGNGVDLAVIYGAIIAVGRTVDALDRKVDALDRRVERKFADQGAEIARLRADVAAYHASVVGHGILISELDERVRRLEQDRGKAA